MTLSNSKEATMSLFRTAKDKKYDVLFAENNFITCLQVEVEAVMNAKGISQTDLAKRMGLSAARVSQILSDNGTNLEARTIARIGHALGVRTIVEFVDKPMRRSERDSVTSLPSGSSFKDWVKAEAKSNVHVWDCMMPSNDDYIAEAA
jgi:transcriptional regulator with XRE-family HTH domain